MQSIQTAAENFPESPYYKVDQILTELGIGEALVTALNVKGIPTPLVHCYLRAPQSRMDVLEPSEIKALNDRSPLVSKYSEVIDRESAHEILTAKLEDAQLDSHREVIQQQRTRARQEKSTMEKVFSNTTTRQIGRTVARELTRGLLGVLGVKAATRRSTKKKTSWF